MNLQEKELIEQARMMGIPAHEFASKFVTRDLVEATLTSVRKVIKLNENQESQLIDRLNDDVRDIVSACVAVIAARGQSAILCTMKSYMGTGKNLRVVLDTDGDDPQRHALTDQVTNRVLLVLAPDEYHDALDSNKPQRDQKELSLEEKPTVQALQELADKSVEGTGLTATVIKHEATPYELALNHVTSGGEISPKAIQTAAGVKRKDVADLILQLADNGVISDPDPDTGHRTLVGAAVENAGSAEPAKPSTNSGDESFSEDLYADVVLLVQKEKRATSAFIKSNFQVDEDTANSMLLRMEQDGVISEENDMGGRAIYD